LATRSGWVDRGVRCERVYDGDDAMMTTELRNFQRLVLNFSEVLVEMGHDVQFVGKGQGI
jgi:hypothetical protein